jgi:Tfp pilus assembly protein PilZ
MEYSAFCTLFAEKYNNALCGYGIKPARHDGLAPGCVSVYGIRIRINDIAQRKQGGQNMISTLQRSFNLGKENTTKAVADFKMKDYEIIARLYYLIGNLSEEQQKELFRQFLNGSVANFLLKAAIDMPSEQQFIFMKHLEEMQPQAEQPDRRSDSRKDCLINVIFKIRGQKFRSYILDISKSGAFIETSTTFSPGLKMILGFASPEDRQRLDLIGEIVWADTRGVGVRFVHLTKDQSKKLKSFTEKTDEVLEIAS